MYDMYVQDALAPRAASAARYARSLNKEEQKNASEADREVHDSRRKPAACKCRELLRTRTKMCVCVCVCFFYRSDRFRCLC